MNKLSAVARLFTFSMAVLNPACKVSPPPRFANTHVSADCYTMGNSIGKLECGSAQPSL